MRELTTAEIENVSGAGLFDFVAGAIGEVTAGVLGAIMGATTGMGNMVATVGAGNNGVLGAGILAQAVAAVVGCVAGGVQGAAYGVVNGVDATAAEFTAVTNQWFSQTV